MQRAVRADRLGHALLLTGPGGIGKRRFADLFGASLLCAQPDADGLPCGTCEECALLRAGNHPDLTRLVPDADSKSGEIKVDQVRDLCARQSMTSNRGRRTLFRIAPAEAMNAAAANSLLKTLEEPASATLLLLVSEAPGSLPPTIRSRCQPVTLAAPPAEIALSWLRARLPSGAPAEQLLAVGRGAPLRAIELAGDGQLERRDRCLRELRQVGGGDADPIAIAETWQSEDADLLLVWLASWLSDCLRLLADPHATHLTNPDQRQPLVELSRRLRAEPGHRFLQQVLSARAEAGTSVNKQLLFEALLLRWAHLTRQPTARH